MKKLLLALALLALFLSGCGVSDGACCESPVFKSKGLEPDGKPVPVPVETPYEVKSDDPIPNPDTNITTFGDPIAIISIEGLKAGEPTTFSCRDSHDTDEYDIDDNGYTIVSCEWSFTCHKKDGFVCHCPKKGGVYKGDLKKDITVTPHPDSESVDVTLTVIDNEGKTNTVTKNYKFN